MVRNRGQALRQQGRRMLQVPEPIANHSALIIQKTDALISAKQHYPPVPPPGLLAHSRQGYHQQPSPDISHCLLTAGGQHQA